ncbi:MAG: PTS lactose/cellobiose transporter subunit IIA [Erysipelotrichaceae bacterium]|nr:PTS lactose/cellobiose transporter subunit IIA [Erysipelotrichaceae bacterium]
MDNNSAREEDYLTAFQLIAVAGDARSLAIKAGQLAAEGRFSEAESHLEQARQALASSHETQTDLLVEEARGNPQPVNIFMVHAMDHLSIAIQAIDHGEDLLKVYRQLCELRLRVDERK